MKVMGVSESVLRLWLVDSRLTPVYPSISELAPTLLFVSLYAIYFASFLNWNLMPTDKKAECIWTEKEMQHKT